MIINNNLKDRIHSRGPETTIRKQSVFDNNVSITTRIDENLFVSEKAHSERAAVMKRLERVVFR
jgi:hypothetical protein